MNDSGGQTLRVHFNQFVQAPIERVYAAYIDPALLSTLMGLKAITDVSGPLDRPGATFVGVVFGPYRPRSEVLAAEAPVLHDMGGQAGLGMGWRWTARFAEKDDGTEITFDSEARFPGGLISGLLRRSQEGGRMERGTRDRLVKFAKLVESGEP
ncbi:MAG TPA: SRPBCC family protein [Candidatus Limnocylindrales bacterium]|nr:SRPBCC family protein [Candidatus Limnocylindrales bacterium]